MKLDTLVVSFCLVGTTDGFASAQSAARGVTRRVSSKHSHRRSYMLTYEAQQPPGRNGRNGRKRPRTQHGKKSVDSATCVGTNFFSTPAVKLAANYGDQSIPVRLPPRIQEAVERLDREPDLKAKCKLLVELGDAFAHTDAAILPRSDDHTWMRPQKVSGCVSEVYVAVSVVANQERWGKERSLLHNGGNGPGEVVSIRGTADARLSRGLVALLALGLDGESPETVLSLRGDAIATAIGLRAGLTDSRINGLGNVLRVIQEQIQRQRLNPSRGVRVGKREEGIPPSAASESNDSPDVSINAPERAIIWGSDAGNWFPPRGEEEEVAMLLSGGVDSSVALRLLQDEGYRIRAFYLKIWLEDELSHLGECPWQDDLAYAMAVCEQAGVPLEVVSLQREYWEQVVSYTVREAREGRTPNPDVMCNSRIKFGMFYEYVGRHFRHVATGHYARLERDGSSASAVTGSGGGGASGGSNSRDGNVGSGSSDVVEGSGRVRLLLSPDEVKDQTYFLCALNQTQLRKALFPLGAFTKERVRELAEIYDLPTKDRRDSQGICFLGKLKFDDFLRHHLGEAPGKVVDRETGETIGEHRGLWFHTIGQRKGVGPGLNPGYVNLGPWYVSNKDLVANVLEVTNDRDAIEGPREAFQVEALSWIAGHLPVDLERSGVMRLQVKTRHGPQMKNCVLRLLPLGAQRSCTRSPAVSGAREESVYGDQGSSVLGGGGDLQPPAVAETWTRGDVRLETRDSALAPGQFAAFYSGGECLGAGVISDSAEATANCVVEGNIAGIAKSKPETEAAATAAPAAAAPALRS